jgi:hypothetical protein
MLQSLLNLSTVGSATINGLINLTAGMKMINEIAVL